MLWFDYNDIESNDEDITEDDLIYLNDIQFYFCFKRIFIFWIKYSKKH